MCLSARASFDAHSLSVMEVVLLWVVALFKVHGIFYALRMCISGMGNLVEWNEVDFNG